MRSATLPALKTGARSTVTPVGRRALVIRLAWVTIAAAALSLGPPAVGSTPQAAAHTELVATVPAAGSRNAAPVERVQLTFRTAIEPQFANLALTVDGGPAQRLTSEVDDRTVIATPPAPGRADEQWEVAYRVVATDGHPISGTLSFTVAGAGPASTSGTSPVNTTPPTPPAGQSGPPATQDWHLPGAARWIVPPFAIAVLVSAIFAAAWGPRLAERRQAASTPYAPAPENHSVGRPADGETTDRSAEDADADTPQ